MTQTALAAPVGDLGHLLRGGLAALDITQSEFEQVVRRYEQLGEVLDKQWSSTYGQNAVFPQGSFKLGTVVRNVHRNDDIDIDLVAKRDIAKTSISQQELKEEIGQAVRTFARTPDSGRPDVEESSRCWTLTWPDMHMDVLPAIPNRDSTRDDLLITDTDVRTWLSSNPTGYAAWFHARMSPSTLTASAEEAKRLDIEGVPEWRRRTTLQRVVQALKRHRDVHFAEHLHDRPASIVITTLAAHAYAGGTGLYDSLRQVVSQMGSYLEWSDHTWTLSNPAQPAENFLDGWAAEPTRAEHFFEWLRAAQDTFSGFESKSGLHEVLPLLEASFGRRFARGANDALSETLDGARRNKALRMQTGGTLAIASTASAAQGSRTVKGHHFAGGLSPR